MNQHQPFVTVLMPVYNGESYLTEAIESILDQTYRHFELLLINEGSTDNTRQIIEGFRDERIRLINNEQNLRLIATLNKGIDLAKGKYIVRMDADDLSLPHRIEKQVAFMEEHSEVGLAGSFLQNIGESNNQVTFKTEHQWIVFHLLFSTYLRHPSVIIRKSVLDKYALKFDKEYLHVEDHQMFIKIAEVSKVAIIPEVLLKYRVHEQSISARNQEIQARVETQIRREQLNKLGITVSDRQMDLYNRFIALIKPENNRFLKEKILRTQENIAALGELLREITEKNKEIRMVEPAIIRPVFAEKFWDICTTSSHLGVWVFSYFQQHPLSAYHKTGTIPKVKFLLKCLVKKKYAA